MTESVDERDPQGAETAEPAPAQPGSPTTEPEDSASDSENSQRDDRDLLRDIFNNQSSTGTQGNNYGVSIGVVYGSVLPPTKPPGEDRLTADQVRGLQAVFVEPPLTAQGLQPITLDGLASRLQRDGSVLIIGPAGTGRRITAFNLLAKVTQDIREMPCESPKEHEAGGILLDMTAERPDPLVGRTLIGRGRELRTHGAYQVVVLDSTEWLELGPADQTAITIGANPDPVEVFRRQLAWLFAADLHLPFTDDTAANQWAAHPEVREALCGMVPVDAVRLAKLVHDKRGADADTDPIRHEILSRYRLWETEISTWLAEEHSARETAFLIAAATLDGSPASWVLPATEALLSAWGTADSAPGTLDGPGLTALASTADIELPTRDWKSPLGRVRRQQVVSFKRPGYARAVLQRVLDDRPGTFDRVFWKWLVDIPNHTGDGDSTAAHVATVAVDLAMSRRNPEVIIDLARAWSRVAGMQSALVEGVLTTTALSEEIGADVRRGMLSWAYSGRSLQVSLLLGVARVCGGPFADAYPRMALVRLGHLANRRDDAVGRYRLDEQVAEALWTMWRNYPAHRRLLLASLHDWMTVTTPSTPVGRRRTALRFLARVLRPEQDASAPSSVEPLDRVIATHLDGLADCLAAACDDPMIRADTSALLAGVVADIAEHADQHDAFVDLLGATVQAPPPRAARVVTLSSAIDSKQSSATSLLRGRTEARLNEVDPLRQLPAPFLTSKAGHHD